MHINSHGPSSSSIIAPSSTQLMSSRSPSAPQSQGEVESNATAPISSTPAPNGPLTAADVKETVDRIRANQDYQAVLQLALRSLEKAITKNHDLQVRLFALLDITYHNNFETFSLLLFSCTFSTAFY